LRLSRFIGLLAYYLLPGRRAIAEVNLGIAFPKMRDRGRKKCIIVQSFQNLALGVLYILWLKKITREQVDELVEVDRESLGHMRAAFAKKKGVLLLVGHFGNWELLGVSCGFLDLPPLNSIARKLDNPYLERKLRQFRMASANHVIYKQDAIREAVRSLRRNECVPVLIDQNVAKNGIFVDFFNKKAATTRALASLSLATGTPIIPATSYPLKDGRYRTVFSPEICIEPGTDKKKNVQRLTQKCTDFLEERIREHPEAWMWGHRRWKKRPRGEPPVYP